MPSSSRSDMKPEANYSDRNALILHKYKNGESLEGIANIFHITRSRAQQIITKELGKAIKKTIGVGNVTAEDDKLLKLAIREEIREISTKRTKQKNSKTKIEIERGIRDKQALLPPVTKFFSIASYARALNVETPILYKYFPDIVRAITDANKNKWSRYYNQCRSCGTTSVKHQSHGLCEDCYYKSDIWKEINEASRVRNYHKRKEYNQLYHKKYLQRPHVIEKMKLQWDLKLFGGNREKAIQKGGYKCIRCGITQSDSQKKLGKDLYVYHSDGNAKNNDLDNLITVCKRCFPVVKFHGVNSSQFKKVEKITSIKPELKNLPTRIVEKGSVQALLFEISNHYNIPEERLFNQTRKKEVALARQVAMYILRDVYQYSYPRIGKIFKRDHTTAMHAFNKIQKLSTTDKSIAQSLEILTAMTKK